MSMMFWTIFSIITLTILTVVTAWVIMKIIYKHRVRVIDLGKQSIELDYKARDYFKDGVRYWRLDKERHKELKLMPLPPADAINLAKRGKKSVTVWRTETGEYIYALRKELLSQEELNNELNNIPEKIKQVIDEKKRKELVSKYKHLVLKKWEQKGKVLPSYEPFTTKQRIMIMNNFVKANARKRTSLREQLPTLISIGAFVILIISLFIFWGDIAKPALEARDMELKYVTIQKESLEILQDIQRGQQRIESEQGEIKQRISSIENGG